MRDYERGALDALSWAYRVLERSRSLREAKAEVGEALERMRAGCAFQFDERLKLLPR
ncbi:MAG: hypothetical protein QXQ76_03130 [Candidatus Bathyarchaeia archaeon]